MYENIDLTPYTCCIPTYYFDNKCDYCEFKPYAKCKINGYDNESMKLYFKKKQEIKELNDLEEIKLQETKGKNKNKKKNRRKKVN